MTERGREKLRLSVFCSFQLQPASSFSVSMTISSSGTSFCKPQFPDLSNGETLAILPTMDDIFSNPQGCGQQPGRVDSDPGAGVGI